MKFISLVFLACFLGLLVFDPSPGWIALGIAAGTFARVLFIGFHKKIDRLEQTVAEGISSLQMGAPISRDSASSFQGTSINQKLDSLQSNLTELRRRTHLQETTLSSMQNGVILLDPEDKILSINQEARRLLGIKPGSVSGKKITKAVKIPEVSLAIENVKIDPSTPQEIQVRRTGVLSTFFQISRKELQSSSSNEDLLGSVLVLTDITRLRKLEKIRQDFVANVSHELRTPVTSIKGFVETLLDGAMDSPAEAERFLGIINNQSERLLSIIEDLLMLARLEGTPDTPEFEAGLLMDLVGRAARLCEYRAEKKQIKLSISGEEDLRIRADWSLLEQAVVNLVENAIKYSDPGTEVEIITYSKNSEAKLSIKDFGPGIPKKSLPRIFERFYRVDKARSRTLGGTGLGLAIVKHVASFHGGRVTVKSEVGEGSEFIISLPIDLETTEADS